MAVVCRMVCGESDRFSREGVDFAAAATAKARRLVTLSRVIASPLRFGNSADVAPRSGFNFNHALVSLAIECHSGTVRCLRPLPCRWTHAALSRIRAQPGATVMLGPLYRLWIARRIATLGATLVATQSVTFARQPKLLRHAITASLLTDYGVLQTHLYPSPTRNLIRRAR